MNERINRAIEFASQAHKKQKRKGSKLPYIIHPFSIAFYLLSKGCSDDVIIAALFHDILEDTLTGKHKIEEQFGSKVLKIVENCTDNKRLSWKNRKLYSFEKYLNSNDDILFVSIADKMHNMYSMLEDYNRIQDRLWTKFSKNKEDYIWYFTELNNVFNQAVSDADSKLKSVYFDFEKTYNTFINTIK